MVHGGNRILKSRLVTHGVAIENFPLHTCACGKEKVYHGDELSIADALAEKILAQVNGDAVTVDWDSLNPTLIEQIRTENEAKFREWLRKTPKRTSLTGLTGEEAEQLLLATLFPNDGEPEVSCETLVGSTH